MTDERCCDVCGQAVTHFRRVCAGDGRVHRHGMVHTLLRGSTNDLVYLGVDCGCADKDASKWGRSDADEPADPDTDAPSFAERQAADAKRAREAGRP